MNKVVIDIKVDPETKQAAQELANDLGLTLSDLINTQLKQLVNRQRLILEYPKASRQMSAKLEAELDQVYREVKQGDVSQLHTSLDSFWDDLNQPPSK